MTERTLMTIDLAIDGSQVEATLHGPDGSLIYREYGSNIFDATEKLMTEFREWAIRKAVAGYLWERHPSSGE